MQYRQLGRSGLTVSAVAMGCWALAGDYTWGPQDDADSLATVQAALDAGITLFDTAEGYGDGRSEEILGRALAGRRDRAVIATKVSDAHLTAAEVRVACERSLRRLGTDYIDLYQVHWPNRNVPLQETFDALEKLREHGKVRAIGVCNFGPHDLADLMQVGQVASNQLPYSLLWRAIEHGLRQQCMDAGVGILCYGSLEKGLLTGKFTSADQISEGRARTRHYAGTRPGTRHGEPGCEAETFAAIERLRVLCREAGLAMADAALAWVLQQPGVAVALAGARTPEQARENARAADLRLPVELVSELAAATDEVKRILGANPDPYQAVSRIR